MAPQDASVLSPEPAEATQASRRCVRDERRVGRLDAGDTVVLAPVDGELGARRARPRSSSVASAARAGAWRRPARRDVAAASAGTATAAASSATASTGAAGGSTMSMKPPVAGQHDGRDQRRPERAEVEVLQRVDVGDDSG